MKKLIVISDTKAYINGEDKFLFTPVLREFESLLTVFDEIQWLTFLNDTDQNNFSKLNNEQIKVTTFNSIGGNTVIDKFIILINIPKLFFTILKLIKKSDYIHLRSPSVPSVLALLLVPLYPKKIFWYKYAGNWEGKASISYIGQRKILKLYALAFNNIRLTINGNWESHRHIFDFKNPCLTKFEIEKGNVIINKKLQTLSNDLKFCFVGSLTLNKGIFQLLEALSKYDFEKKIELNVVGSSKYFEELKLKYKDITGVTIKFHGYLSTDKVQKIYEISDFLFLPSESEGFPKVVSEAMNYGVIPVITDISCINQIIRDGLNGFLLDSNSISSIMLGFDRIQILTFKKRREIIIRNMCILKKFQYETYVNRIASDIYNI